MYGTILNVNVDTKVSNKISAYWMQHIYIFKNNITTFGLSKEHIDTYHYKNPHFILVAKKREESQNVKRKY